MNALPQKHDVLWLEDGNVVLMTDTLLFRVHKTVLSLHSTVLKDMFGLPLGPHAGSESFGGAGGLEDGAYRPDAFEGLPLVQLHGDNGEDVAHLLLAIYERGYYDREDDDTPLEKVIALLTLSAKYDVTTVRTDVLKQLSRNYPSKLAEYEELEREYARNKERKLFGRRRRDCHFALLTAASITSHSQSDIQALLPSLYFACACAIPFGRSNPGLVELDVDILHVVLQGHLALAFNFRHSLSTLIDETSPAEGCPYNSGVKHCKTSRRSPHTEAMSWFLSTCFFPGIKGKHVVNVFFEKRCESCQERISELFEEKKALLWDSLPSQFGFESWGAVLGTT